jgi:hypothetical protein
LVVLGGVLRGPAGVVLLGRVAEMGAAVAFAAHLWPRIISRIG